MRIKSLQGLRGVAFCAIYISHAAIGNFSNLGSWGVSIFLVLSGFLMSMNYYNKELSVSGFSFARKKIRGIYPLHIATTLAWAVWVFYLYFRIGNGSLFNMIRGLVVNAFMVNTWLPYQELWGWYNGPAWYLCPAVFCYFCFPALLKILKKNPKKERLFMAVCLLTQVLVACIAAKVGNDTFPYFIKWVTYFFPLVRLLDFFIGMCMGTLFLFRKKELKNTSVCTVLEVTTIVVILVSMLIFAKEVTILGNEAVKYTLLYIPSTVAIIWLLAEDGGCFRNYYLQKYWYGWATLADLHF